MPTTDLVSSRVVPSCLAAALTLVAASCGGGGGSSAPLPATIVGRVAVEGAAIQSQAVAEIAGDEMFLQARELGDVRQALAVDGRVGTHNPRDCLRVGGGNAPALGVTLRGAGAAAALWRCSPAGDAMAVGKVADGAQQVVVPMSDGAHLVVIVAGAAAYRVEFCALPAALPAAALAADDQAYAEQVLADADAEIVPGEVVIRGSADLAPALALAGRCGLEVHKSGGGLALCKVTQGPALLADRRGRLALAHVLGALRRQIDTAATVEPNFVLHAHQAARTPNDPMFAAQWALRMINSPMAWASTTGQNIVVAVVDTGIRSLHPDLRDNVLGTGWDFVDDDASPEDPLVPGASLHGSHVAGIVAAVTDNQVGVASVGWNTKILPLRALSNTGGTSFDIAQAILYAAGLPNESGRIPPQTARVINLSLGSSTASAMILDAIRRARSAGAVIVASAGNGAQQGNPINYPAAFEEVIAVGSVGPSGNRAPYSQVHGYVDVAAPGGDTSGGASGGILSTVSVLRSGTWYFDYAYYQGTSMAAPCVAGTIALMLAVNPRLSADDVATLLARTATDRGAPGRDPEYGAGVINAARAVAEAAGGPAPVLRIDRSELVFAAAGSASCALAADGARPVSGLAVTVSDSWLHAALDATTTPARLSFTVDPAAFAAEPVRQTRVLVRGEGGTSVEVMVFAITLTAQARGAGGVLRSPLSGGMFRFAPLPAGPWELRVGADSNGNGSLDDPGDWDSGAALVHAGAGLIADVGVVPVRRR